ncbi:MAG: hemerythrin family protein [Candidatus Marinimicrobia bacterium]|nr:hemerythrin family protein [Candidatus Neomarinimicrobiota bacterium]
MVFIEWKDAYSVNIADIDKQHKHLIDIINRLHSAILSGKDSEALSYIMTDLVYYTIYHFETEEKFFDEHNYPQSEQHKNEHKDLAQKVAVLKQKHDSGEKVLSIDVMSFLREWLQDHILGSDAEFGPYLNNKGVH